MELKTDENRFQLEGWQDGCVKSAIRLLYKQTETWLSKNDTSEKHCAQSLLGQEPSLKELTHHLTTPSKSSREVPAHFTNYEMKAKKKESPKKKKSPKKHHHRVQKRSSGWVETTRTGTDPTSKKLK